VTFLAQPKNPLRLSASAVIDEYFAGAGCPNEWESFMELKDQIKRMIVERLFLNVEPEDIDNDAPLMQTYGIDSVALFELVVGLEDEFGVVMDDSDFQIDTFKNVNSIAAFVEQKQAA
jgi:acyl carrier protein